MKAALPWIVLALALLYLAGIHVARRNVEAYYAQCAEEYGRRADAPRDIEEAVREIRACAEARMNPFERFMTLGAVARVF